MTGSTFNKDNAMDAARWRFVRDVLWRGEKLGDLPQPLMYHFVRDDNRTPNSFAFDAAIDALREEHR